jgi:hypothetical protein
MGSSFPVDMSLKAVYDSSQDKIGNGDYSEVRWLELDGIKGVLVREATPEHEDSPQRLIWQGYRTHNGQLQLVILMLASQARDFPRHEPTFTAILNTTRFAG